MIRGVTYSRGAAAGLAAALTVALLATLGRAAARRSGRAAEARREATAADLRREIDAKREFGAEPMAALRRQARLARAADAGEAVWARLEERLRLHWRREAAGEPARSSDNLRRGSFVYLDPLPADWPEILAAVQDVEALPGLGIETIEMVAAHEGGLHPLEVVRMRVVGRRPATDSTSSTP